MNGRLQIAGGIFGLAVALLAGGCSYTSLTAKAHAPFVPPKAKAASVALLPEPPALAPPVTIFEITPTLQSAFAYSEERREAEALVQQANLRFQHGRSLYQANNANQARAEFDAAVDLVFTATQKDPFDRQEFSRKLDDMVDLIHRYDLAGLGASEIPEGRFEQAPLEDILNMTFPVDPRLKAKVRDEVAATASQLPLMVNDVVLGYINYFSHYGHRTIVAAIERSGRYRPMISRILDEEGLPQEIIHLAQAESGFYARAVSRMAAAGMWQFVKFRGSEYGLKQTPLTDDRLDPEMATRAAAHHLHDLYTEFGDWYLALAAYNCGPGVVEDAVARTGYADYWELRSRGVLPGETTNYVPIILAMTIMEKNATAYGLDAIQMDAPLEYDTVEVRAKTGLALVSDITDTPLAELADLNPAVLKNVVPADYPLHVPKGAATELVSELELVPADHRDSWRMHRLGAGETLAEVGKRYGVTLAALLAANNLQSPDAKEGDLIVIPAAARPEPAPSRPVTSARRTGAASAVKSKAPMAQQKPAAKPKPKAPAKPAAKNPVTVAGAKGN